MKAELSSQLDDCADELQKIKKRIDGDKFDDMVAFLQRYAIIKACGTIEAVIKNMIADHVDAGAGTELQNYISVKIRDSSANPKWGKIAAILNEFSSEWRATFEAKLSSHSNEKGSLNSLVQLRNDFAHGRSPNATINTIIQYYYDSIVIVKLVEDTLEGK